MEEENAASKRPDVYSVMRILFTFSLFEAADRIDGTPQASPGVIHIVPLWG